MDIDVVVNILDFVNEVMFFDAMEVALAHVRGMIDDLQNNGVWQHFSPRFKPETRALIHHVRHDLAVVDAWSFFMQNFHHNNPLMSDFMEFCSLNAIFTYIDHDILWELGGLHWGLSGSDEEHVVAYLRDYQGRIG